MGQEIVFTAIKSKADNRKLEQDDKGYYRVILGAIDAFNTAGDFYLSDGVKDLIDNQSHSLSRRLKSGYLKGECGHPSYQTGMSKADFFARNLRIELSNTSHHIRELILTPTKEPSGFPGKGTTILIEGWIKPSGPLGDALKKDLDNPDQNVPFSIRSFTQDSNVNGINTKKILQIVTWDWVLEPGIQTANKWSTLDKRKVSVESLDLCRINLDELANGDEISKCFNCSLESKDDIEITTELIKSVQSTSKPHSILLKW